VTALGPLLLAAAAAQAAPQTPSFAVGVEAVYVDVFVTDRGRPVAGLGAGNFELRDAGRRRDSELVAEVPIELPPEVTTQGDPMATVIVTFVDALGSRSFEVGPALLGARPDRTYRLDVPAVTVVLEGPLRRLDEMELDDLVVEIPVGELEVGDNAVVPTILAPRGLEVAQLVPETVRVSVAAPA